MAPRHIAHMLRLLASERGEWWRTEGCKHYPEAKALQILADGGGSNSCTARAWNTTCNTASATGTACA